MTPSCREEVLQWQEPFPRPSSYSEFYINTKKAWVIREETHGCQWLFIVPHVHGIQSFDQTPGRN